MFIYWIESFGKKHHARVNEFNNIRNDGVNEIVQYSRLPQLCQELECARCLLATLWSVRRVIIEPLSCAYNTKVMALKVRRAAIIMFIAAKSSIAQFKEF